MSFDSKLRCGVVDFYFSLYGTKQPLCLPNPILADILKPQPITSSITPITPASREPSPIQELFSHNSNQKSSTSKRAISDVSSPPIVKVILQ